MFNYVLRRLLIGLMTLFVITVLIMALIRSLPGDAVSAAIGEDSPAANKVSAEAIANMRKSYGLDKPWYIGYWKWLGNVLQGDFGRSLHDQQPVTRRIADRIGPTLSLSLISITLVYLASIPIGLYATARNGRWQEQLLTSALYLLYSFPSLVMALYLLLLFAVKLNVLPLYGSRSDPEIYDKLSTMEQAFDRLKHMVLPVFCYSYTGVAYYTRFIRSNLLEVIRQDYVRTARAKGLSEPVVFFKHAFRNALIPLVTLLGLALPGLVSGSIILERIFNWPGMGNLFIEAITMRDYPVVMGVTFMFALLVLAGNLISDLLYAVVDPRISLR